MGFAAVNVLVLPADPALLQIDLVYDLGIFVRYLALFRSLHYAEPLALYEVDQVSSLAVGDLAVGLLRLRGPRTVGFAHRLTDP